MKRLAGKDCSGRTSGVFPTWLVRQIALVLAIGCLSLNAWAAGGKDAKGSPAIAPEKERKIRLLLELTGADALGNQVTNALITTLSGNPAIPAEFFTRFRALAKQMPMIDLVVPVYAKHLDEKDIDAAIVFFQSPAGRNLAKAQPAMVQEGMEIGRSWGMKLAQQAMAEINADKKTDEANKANQGRAAPPAKKP